MIGSAPTALITGASRGIGYGIAHRLAERGWALTLTARNEQQLLVVKAELEGLGAPRVEARAGEISDDAFIEELIADHSSSYESMSALVLAAGTGSAGPIEGYSMRRFDKQFAVNTRAPFALVSQALPLLRATARMDPSRTGRIIALASLEGTYPEEGLAAYGASKSALISLIKSINIEEATNGVTASAISPGYVNTDMSAWVTDRIAVEQMIAVGDIVKVVELILDLSPTAVLPHIVINRVGGGAYHA